ncbi:MAG: hypothetical protein CMJ94_09385 [Planctomycetes bacterium]|nr:hypothetical protein [Planctomycetota bacterium]
MKTRARKNGFSLLEVVIGMTVLVLVATTAVGSLRTGIATLSATEDSALAIDAIREFSEYTYGFSVTELDNLTDTVMSPVLANGDPLPGADNLSLSIEVVPVNDLDPLEILENPLDSLSRIITVTAVSNGVDILEASWLVADVL